jgi:hypothetical protein
MKQFMLKTTLPLVMVLAAILIIGPGCPSNVTPPTPAPACNVTSSPFRILYNAIKSSTSPIYQELNTIDLVTREYTFQLTGGDTKICSIGYQAEPGIPSGTYKMSILDGTTVLFTGNLSFGTTSMTYVSITPVQLQLNRSYIMRREATNYAGNLFNTTGQVLTIATGAPLPVPLVGPSMKIMQTGFYGSTGTPINNLLLPNIDFGTQP